MAKHSVMECVHESVSHKASYSEALFKKILIYKVAKNVLKKKLSLDLHKGKVI